VCVCVCAIFGTGYSAFCPRPLPFRNRFVDAGVDAPTASEAFDEWVQRLAPAKRPAANVVRRMRLTFSYFEAAPDPPE